ncbi:MAG: glycosyltransferase [Brucellaceae bacterium]|nr:glycosyltransferase [Brucellaceae bacterium]
MIPFGSVSLNETAVAEVESQRRTGLTGSPAGIPVPAARRQPGSRPDPSLFNPVFTGRSRTVYWLLSAVWIGLLAWFWAWWLQPSNIISLPRYIAVSLLFAWLTILPAYFIFLFAGALRPKPAHVTGRVAMIVTKAPSEPFPVVQKTLSAMLAQEYHAPYDVWLADEDPAPETLAWCRDNGVRVSSRKGVAAYHRTEWPRRTRCKEGNLAWFYDTQGYARYDFVSQLDADHVPAPGYLSHMMAPFADGGVGYVSAPSVCDANAAASWSARGRLHVEASMHGSMQTGYTNGLAPLCIGSHYAVRTQALRQIGGLGPELAEDHSTTLIMNSFGWRGVHAVDAEAHGDGPQTFADLAIQEFQWARSVVTILLQYSPVYFPTLPPKKRLQFLFCELWYPLFSVAMAAKFLLPVYALWIGEPVLNVTFPQFVLHFAPLSAWLLLMAYWWRATGTYRPANVPIISWESMMFLLVQWPWSLLGTLYAIRDRITGKFVDFRITPKGSKEDKALPLRVLMPYMTISLISGSATALLGSDAAVWGFRIFAAVNAVAYALVVIVLVALHYRESGHTPRLAIYSAPALLAAIALLFLPLASVSDYGLRGIRVLEYGQNWFRLTSEVYAPVGAGRSKEFHLKFNPRWLGEDEKNNAGNGS